MNLKFSQNNNIEKWIDSNKPSKNRAEDTRPCSKNVKKNQMKNKENNKRKSKEKKRKRGYRKKSSRRKRRKKSDDMKKNMNNFSNRLLKEKQERNS